MTVAEVQFFIHKKGPHEVILNIYDNRSDFNRLLKLQRQRLEVFRDLLLRSLYLLQ